ncbi:MAG: ATP-binding cassette domain-containing protein [Bacteroidia bacterium]|nr:ATP-binding cassette domain-containing protein [Bacteroidia bacterium]
MHKLEIDSVVLEFDLRKVLSDIYLKCETGKITGLLGRNGQGKTCLMNIINGSLEPQHKSVRFDSLVNHNPLKTPKLLLYLPQFNFIPEQLTLKRIFQDFELEFSDFEKTFPEINTSYKSSIKYLSGGYRRIIEVYIIIKSKSQFALLDEPFSHIMPLHIEKIKELLIEEKQHKGILITDHLYQHITSISDSLYVLENGKTHLTKHHSDLKRLGYINT